MLLVIILALLVIPTKSLMPLAAINVDFTFDAAVAIAGLLSYIGLFGYIFWPQGTSGKSLPKADVRIEVLAVAELPCTPRCPLDLDQ